MEIRVQGVDLFVTECRTRLPFRFGATTMTSAPLLTARVRITGAAGAGETEGFSADLLVPKWFDKDPRTSNEEDRAALLEGVHRASEAWSRSPRAESVFAGWWRVYRERIEALPEDSPERLVRGFGVALVERAVLDAVCRAAGRSFFEALHENLFAFRPELVHPELAGWSPSTHLPREPATSVRVRHTIGLADALRAQDLDLGSIPEDGLPRTLEESVRRYGLGVFKLKLCGRVDEDRARVLTVAEVLGECLPELPEWTADGNEQFPDAHALVAFLDELESHALGQAFLARLLFIEQPLPRARTFATDSTEGIAALAARVPVILDEADHGVSAFPRALELGYRGISVKNCKGVFRALLNRGLCDVRGGGAFQSGEDLTNLGVLSLQQDLATVAALGIEHVERNGHHYFHGLDHLPPDEVRAALRAHADLYEPLGDGATLRITAGRLALGSLQVPGYGYDVGIRTGERTPLADGHGSAVRR